MPPTAKPAHKQTVRLPPDLWERLQVAADANRRSVNMQIVVTLEAAYPGPSWVAEDHPRPLRYPQDGSAYRSAVDWTTTGDGVSDVDADEPSQVRPLLYPQDGNASMDEDYLPGDGVSD